MMEKEIAKFEKPDHERCELLLVAEFRQTAFVVGEIQLPEPCPALRIFGMKLDRC